MAAVAEAHTHRARTLDDLLGAGIRSTTPVRDVADAMNQLSMPTLSRLRTGEKLASLGLATIHTEVMWEFVAAWSMNAHGKLAKSAPHDAVLTDLETLSDDELVPDSEAETPTVGLAIALKTSSTAVMAAALHDASQLLEFAWTVDKASTSPLDLAGALKPFDFCRRGVATGQDQFWDVVPFLPELFRNEFQRAPTVTEFQRLLRALKVYNVRFSEAALEIFSAAKGAAANLYWREYSAKKQISHIDILKAYVCRAAQRPGEFVIGMVPEVYGHDLVTRAMDKNPTIYTCSAATAVTHMRVDAAANEFKKYAKPTSVLIAHLDWCCWLAMRHMAPFMKKQGILVDRPSEKAIC